MDELQIPFPIRERKPKIGLLASWIESEYQSKVIAGAVKYAREKGINLFCFEGGSVNSPFEIEIGRNIIYDLIEPGELDGLVVVSPGIGSRATYEQIVEFVKQFDYMPLVSINMEIDGCSSVVVDNAPGFRDLLCHLIEVHHYRRFAFVAGLPNHRDAVTRYQVFLSTLQENEIPFDEKCWVQGDFTAISGEEAIRILIDERKAEFEVLVACNDEMALGALDALNQRGLRVPDDLAVVGFDNIEKCSYAYPPLTSVSQSLEGQGRLAVELLLKVIFQDMTPQRLKLSSMMVLRESCGCYTLNAPFAASAEFRRPELAEVQSRGILPDEQTLVTKMVPNVNSQFPHFSRKDLADPIHQFIAGLYRELVRPNGGKFIKTMSVLIDHTSHMDEYIQFWQMVISELRLNLLPLITESMAARVEDLAHQALLTIGKKAVMDGKLNYQRIMHSSMTINHISEELLSIINISELHEILERHLPHIKINTFYLLELEEKTGGVPCKNRLIMAYHQNQRLKVDGNAGYSSGLIPDFIRQDKKDHVMFILPLVFAKTQFGVVALEISGENFGIYETLRRIISGALNAIFLTRKLQEQEKHLIAQQEHLRNLAEMREAVEGFIRTISLTVEVKDPYTAGHQNRVADLARTIAIEMNLSQNVVECVRMASMVHDLGKISIPAEILNKPGKLTDLELNFIKDHPRVAYDILKNIELPWPIAKVIYEHHERLNGSGYPQRLKGEDIMLESRIIAVADVIEAMASHRPYRPALGIAEALKEITSNRGILYDSAVVDSCTALFEKGYRFIEN